MTRIGSILGSTRPGRHGEAVAPWVHEIASQRTDEESELIHLLDHKLPHLDEALPPSLGQYAEPHTQQWAAKIASLDGFIFVTPEYNHSTSGVLKNAIDFLYAEWNNKAAGFVSYGSLGGARAVEHLRLSPPSCSRPTCVPRSRCRCSTTSRPSACSSPASSRSRR
jgi:NAD(P)H-dependent FMN reductase